MKNILSFFVCLLVIFSFGFSTEDGKLIISSDNISLSHRFLPIALTEVQKPGVNAPTKATKGTTPTVNGLLFDNTNELYQLQFQVPDNWDGASDIEMDLYVVLNQAETAGDVIDWTADYIASSGGSDSVTKTSTNLVITETILAGCAGDGCQYRCKFILAYNDADNPLEIEDVIVMEMHRTNLTNCGGVILIAADAHYAPKL